VQHITLPYQKSTHRISKQIVNLHQNAIQDRARAIPQGVAHPVPITDLTIVHPCTITSTPPIVLVLPITIVQVFTLRDLITQDPAHATAVPPTHAIALVEVP